MQRGANAYAKVGLETGVIAASPHQLIVMLFDGAMLAVSNALAHMKSGDIAAKGQSISKAISIIDNGLRASLDKNAGGSIAENLDALYDYMGRRLLHANLNNQPELLEEVQGLLRDLKGAWTAIDPAANQPLAAPAPSLRAPAHAAYDNLAPRMPALAKA
jgi:flagellar protein FliS